MSDLGPVIPDNVFYCRYCHEYLIYHRISGTKTEQRIARLAHYRRFHKDTEENKRGKNLLCKKCNIKFASIPELRDHYFQRHSY